MTLTKELQVIALAIAGASVVGIMLCFSFLKKRRPTTLSSEEKVSLTLTEKVVISHDTRKFRFSLPTPDHILGLPVGSFINVSVVLDNKLVVRPYTPISSDDDFGYMDLMIKIYSQGKMSQYMDSLQIGNQISVRGPSGKIKYIGSGVFEVIKSKTNTIRVSATKVGMIAGGSGITPMLQIIREVLKQEDDKTMLSLLYSNKTEDDILCRDMLEEMECTKFSVHHTLTQSATPPFSTGRVNRCMIEAHIPPPATDTVILLCGPPGLVKDTCVPILDKMGYLKDNVMLF